MASTGLGKCGLCHRPIKEMTPISSVMLGRPPRAYLCHKACKSQEPEHVAYTVDGRGQLEEPYPAPTPSDEVQVVTSLGDFVPAMASVEIPEPTPAMPVKEQIGQRKTPVKAPAKKAPVKKAAVSTTPEKVNDDPS